MIHHHAKTVVQTTIRVGIIRSLNVARQLHPPLLDFFDLMVFELIQFLSEQNVEVSQRIISTTFGLSPVTINRLIATYVKKGWVHQEDSTTDKRSKVHTLTEKGKKAYNEVCTRIAESFEDLFPTDSKQTPSVNIEEVSRLTQLMVKDKFHVR